MDIALYLLTTLTTPNWEHGSTTSAVNTRSSRVASHATSPRSEFALSTVLASFGILETAVLVLLQLRHKVRKESRTQTLQAWTSDQESDSANHRFIAIYCISNLFIFPHNSILSRCLPDVNQKGNHLFWWALMSLCPPSQIYSNFQMANRPVRPRRASVLVVGTSTYR